MCPSRARVNIVISNICRLINLSVHTHDSICSSLPGLGLNFSSPNCLNLIMFILSQVLEVQLLFYMELLDLTALGSFISPWLKQPKRFAT